MTTPAPTTPPAYTSTYQQAPKTNVLAIVSLVSAFFVSLVAVITGHLALNQIKRTGEGGRGLAIAGLVIGYIGIVSGIIALLVFVPLVIAASAMSVSSY